MDVLTYSPTQVVVTVNGYVIEGWSNISVSVNAPAYKQIRGIRGKNTRVKISDTSATVKITLQQTSIANDVFTLLSQEDRRFGTGRLELTVKDNSGTSLFASAYAYLEGIPESNFSASQTERTWTLLCDSSDYYVGGNGEQGVDFGAMFGGIADKLTNLF